ncbi:hypothetical protein IMCC26134_03600 [Verrucomicrobia bacterium IMCC26134]|nr:hypothetical protein IMCC26134_03600 [Verrucomicrobia bacterium IMCC26134]
MRLPILFSVLLTGALALLPARAASKESAPPNIVILLADDLGHGDLSATGGPIPTPNLDRLLGAGANLTAFHSWPVCSPARAALLTARHPARVGAGPNTEGVLDPAIPTFAAAFRAAGYTTGLFGKWHNSDDPETPEFHAAYMATFPGRTAMPVFTGPGVNAYGFDEVWNYYGGGADQFTRRTQQGKGPVTWWHNRDYQPDAAGYTSDMIVTHAIDFITASRDRPFVAYVPFHAPHSPIQTLEGWVDRVPAKVTTPAIREYYALVAYLDDSVGRILASLDKNGLADNTIVFFASDNGGVENRASNAPYRGGKHSLWQGGLCVPAALRWPGHILPGTTFPDVASLLDVWPTLAGLAAQPLAAPAADVDGRDLSPTLLRGVALPPGELYWSFRATDALRSGKWKVIRYLDHDDLYDLDRDPGEKQNLAAKNPTLLADLTARMDARVRAMGLELSHRPTLVPVAAPAPEGDVLKIVVRQSGPVASKESLFVNLRSFPAARDSRDRLEFDIACGPDSLPSGAGYCLFRGVANGGRELIMRANSFVDQFGRPQSANPPVRAGVGKWERRAIGLSGQSPDGANGHALTFYGPRAGTYEVYVDNLVVRHADGSTTPIWTGAAHGRPKSPAPSTLFPSVSVEVVPVSSAPAL